jgi:2-methylcitrate dehydratase PrpD
VAEQDDVHNGSVFHPAAVVFPAVIAMAEAKGSSGRKVIEAVVAGYETGIRVGEALGRAHYEIFHTTGTAGVVAAAAAVGKLLDLDEITLNHALGTAGTQASGLWEFLRDAADSKQIHAAKASADGLLSALLAQKGVRGAVRIVEGRRGMAAGMSRDAELDKLCAGLGTRWGTLEVSYKWHASCRHTHPAADALRQLLEREAVSASNVRTVVARVHQAAIDVLGAVAEPQTVHQAKFSMGTVLGLITHHGKAGLAEFDEHALSPESRAFAKRVTMQLDPEVDAAYPKKWIGKVAVTTMDGRHLENRVDNPKGDPGYPLTAAEVKDKALRLAAYRQAASADAMVRWIDQIERLEDAPTLSGFFAMSSRL